MLIGNQSGVPATFAVGRLMGKWGSIHATSLRSSPEEEKDEIVASVREEVWPLVEAQQVVPIVDRRFALADAPLAHERLESSAHIGKLLLLP